MTPSRKPDLTLSGAEKRALAALKRLAKCYSQ